MISWPQRGIPRLSSRADRWTPCSIFRSSPRTRGRASRPPAKGPSSGRLGTPSSESCPSCTLRAAPTSVEARPTLCAKWRSPRGSGSQPGKKRRRDRGTRSHPGAGRSRRSGGCEWCPDRGARPPWNPAAPPPRSSARGPLRAWTKNAAGLCTCSNPCRPCLCGYNHISQVGTVRSDFSREFPYLPNPLPTRFLANLTQNFYIWIFHVSCFI